MAGWDIDHMEERLLWRAGANDLFEKHGVRYADTPAAWREHVEKRVRPRGRPILAFLDLPGRWTLLTTDEVLSCHGRFFRRVHRARHASSTGWITLRAHRDTPQREAKETKRPSHNQPGVARPRDRCAARRATEW